MSDNNPVDPTDPKGRKQTPLGDPAVPPNAGAQAGNRSPSGGAGTSTQGGGTAGASATGSGQTSSGSQSSERQEKLREDVNETGEKIKSEAQETARTLADSARANVQAQAERQQHAAAGELGGIAKALRKTAEEVEGQTHYIPLDRLARQAADRLDDLSESLRGSDLRTVMSRLERYTREQPGVVLGGALISGFLLARFLRASGERESGYNDRSVH